MESSSPCPLDPPPPCLAHYEGEASLLAMVQMMGERDDGWCLHGLPPPHPEHRQPSNKKKLLVGGGGLQWRGLGVRRPNLLFIIYPWLKTSLTIVKEIFVNPETHSGGGKSTHLSPTCNNVFFILSSLVLKRMLGSGCCTYPSNGEFVVYK